MNSQQPASDVDPKSVDGNRLGEDHIGTLKIWLVDLAIIVFIVLLGAFLSR